VIIWGSRGKERELAKGEFFCPKCSDLRPYKQKRVSKYFTLYFIPLFETKNLGEYVECQVCSAGYDPQILEPASQALMRMVAATRYALLHGTTPETVRAQLVEGGVPEAAADSILGLAQR
jgi:hypothetical protein